MEEWTVKPEESGAKLVDFIKRHSSQDISARQIKRSIESNGCWINGRSERFATRTVEAGDKVQFRPPETLTKLTRDRILYEDAYLLAYDKPPGFASDDPALAQFALTQQLIHRLDKETSGVLLFAKTEPFRLAMIDLFRAQKVKKVYHCIVDGVPQKRAGAIDNYLGKVRTYQGQAIWGAVKKSRGCMPAQNGAWSEKGSRAACLRCMPITGRTHQIRVHMSEMGHPILGDHQYGRASNSSYKPSRCLLHASEVSFIHPMTGNPLHLTAPLPQDMQAAIYEVLS